MEVVAWAIEVSTWPRVLIKKKATIEIRIETKTAKIFSINFNEPPVMVIVRRRIRAGLVFDAVFDRCEVVGFRKGVEVIHFMLRLVPELHGENLIVDF